ncbi:AAA family ATPase [Proteiniclasticum sp. SCR006]|uniref:AAA family ATPase n=1 Tax=Proteiniclasticum aestuarii TaxID=2817862 RepID=A0A939H5F1_9CLOT|nr:AAA family ATPase [Proteiniclasticum aestuarii]MBO1264504.1 AAA family ATPase [Proteiniclasticum aestuarii]
MNGIKAMYNETNIPQYCGNPLIEALPIKKSKLDEIRDLSIIADWPESIQLLDEQSKIYALDTIQTVFQPIPQTIDLKESVDRLIRAGYVNRNPLARSGDFSQPPSIAIIGISGIGKSTTISRILSMYEQVIYHNEYKSQPIQTTQVVWLKLNTPFDGSLKSLLLEFYSEIDSLLKTNYYERFIKNRATTDVMMQSIYKVSQSCNLGVILIDEVQHLEHVSNKNKMMIMNFFVNLSNTAGVPIIFVSTPSGISVLRQDFRLARRMVSAMDTFIWDKHDNDKIWGLLVESLMRYQITQEKAVCDTGILDAFHRASGGVVDILKKIHISSQVLAMRSGFDRVNPHIIKESAKKTLKLLEPMMKAIESQNPFEELVYSDIRIPETLKNNDKCHIVIKTTDSLRKGNKQMQLKSFADPHDIRVIVKEAGLRGESAYISLKDAGYIIEKDSVLFGGR